MYLKIFHYSATTVGAAGTLEGLFTQEATALPAAVQGYVVISPISGDPTPYSALLLLLLALWHVYRLVMLVVESGLCAICRVIPLLPQEYREGCVANRSTSSACVIGLTHT